MLPEVLSAIGGIWAVKKILGPTFDLMGEELRNRIETHYSKVLSSVHRKIANLEDGKAANLRVTYEALQSASLADSDLVSEYCGGMLAASRSSDGKDDTLVPFVNVVRALSSRQIKLHYDIYRCLEGIKARQFAAKQDRSDWVTPPTPPIFIGSISAGPETDTDLQILLQNNLISSCRCEVIYTISNQEENKKVYAYVYMAPIPSWFGWALYAAAHNQLTMMYRLGIDDFGKLEGADPPKHYGESLEDLLDQVDIRQVPRPDS